MLIGSVAVNAVAAFDIYPSRTSMVARRTFRLMVSFSGERSEAGLRSSSLTTDASSSLDSEIGIDAAACGLTAGTVKVKLAIVTLTEDGFDGGTC